MSQQHIHRYDWSHKWSHSVTCSVCCLYLEKKLQLKEVCEKSSKLSQFMQVWFFSMPNCVHVLNCCGLLTVQIELNTCSFYHWETLTDRLKISEGVIFHWVTALVAPMGAWVGVFPSYPRDLQDEDLEQKQRAAYLMFVHQKSFNKQHFWTFFRNVCRRWS